MTITIRYSAIVFNGNTVVFQIHEQDADYTRWLNKHPYCAKDCFRVCSAGHPHIDESSVLLRGTDHSLDHEVVHFTLVGAGHYLERLNSAIKQSVEAFKAATAPPAILPTITHDLGPFKYSAIVFNHDLLLFQVHKQSEAFTKWLRSKLDGMFTDHHCHYSVRSANCPAVDGGKVHIRGNDTANDTEVVRYEGPSADVVLGNLNSALIECVNAFERASPPAPSSPPSSDHSIAL